MEDAFASAIESVGDRRQRLRPFAQKGVGGAREKSAQAMRCSNAMRSNMTDDEKLFQGGVRDYLRLSAIITSSPVVSCEQRRGCDDVDEVDEHGGAFRGEGTEFWPRGTGFDVDQRPRFGLARMTMGGRSTKCRRIWVDVPVLRPAQHDSDKKAREIGRKERGRWKM